LNRVSVNQGDIMNQFKLAGMTCQGCVNKVRNALRDAGYPPISVTLEPPRLQLEGESSLKELQEIISKAGDYTVVPLESTADGLDSPHKAEVPAERLAPLFIILGYITGGVLLRAVLVNDFTVMHLMQNFMGGFFVVFSLFKLLNLSGFADSYATYDILAARSRGYALAYPFIELALGVAYFVGYQLLLVSIVTFILMAIGSIGVFKALQSKRRFQCACLGTALNLPMTKVTLVEDLSMGVMALAMIIYLLG